MAGLVVHKLVSWPNTFPIFGGVQSGGKKASMSSGRKSKHVAGPRIGGDFRAIISTSTTPNLVGHHQHTLQRKPTLSATLNGYGHIPEHVALVAVVLSQNDWVRVRVWCGVSRRGRQCGQGESTNLRGPCTVPCRPGSSVALWT